MRVLLLSRYSRLGASSRIRSYQYLPFLQDNGVTVEVASLFDDDYVADLYSLRQRQNNVGQEYASQSDVPISLKEKNKGGILQAYLKRVIKLYRCRHYDLLWIEKELFPWLPPLAEQVLSLLGVRYLVDYDDAIFHKYDAHSSLLVRRMLGNKIRMVMEHASLVVAGNPYLADYARQTDARKIEILPTVVDIDRYPERTKSWQAGVFRIGWVGSPSTVWYLNAIAPVLQNLAMHHDIELIVVGGGALKLERVPVRVREWSEATEVREISAFDVGVMPLPDSPYELGKCGYKLIQYMACGVPVIASPVGVNSTIVEHGVNGLLAGDADQWLKMLELLIGDRGRGRAMGTRGRCKVIEHYSLQACAPRLLQLLKEAASP